MNKYEKIDPINKQEADEIFSSDDFDKICYALVAIAFHEPDWKWAQDKCLFFFQSTNSDLSGLSATCLGHIARIQKRLEKEKVIKVLNSRLNNIEIAGRIHDALDDIKQFA